MEKHNSTHKIIEPDNIKYDFNELSERVTDIEANVSFDTEMTDKEVEELKRRFAAAYKQLQLVEGKIIGNLYANNKQVFQSIIVNKEKDINE